MQKETYERSPITKAQSSESFVQAIAQAAADKKAEDILILDMREVCSYTDFFLICEGRSSRQTKAIADEIRLKMKSEGTLPLRVEGEARGDWVLMDYLTVVVHIFTPEARDFYRLEVLWKEAPRVEAAVS
ncbi:MAG: ribosome silencing factor [Actinobacteria bacterium]|nr:ribosome silencing factor [Actinomycetota bacterium]